MSIQRAARFEYNKQWRERHPNYSQEWDRNNLNRRKKISSKYYFKNKNKRLENNKKWCVENKERRMKYHKNNKLKRYGINIEQFNQMLIEQNCCCAICGSKFPKTKSGEFNVDHNHLTNKVRGLLCHNCNLGLGHFKDSLELLEKAKSYLIRQDDPFLINETRAVNEATKPVPFCSMKV